MLAFVHVVRPLSHFTSARRITADQCPARTVAGLILYMILSAGRTDCQIIGAGVLSSLNLNGAIDPPLVQGTHRPKPPPKVDIQTLYHVCLFVGSRLMRQAVSVKWP